MNVISSFKVKFQVPNGQGDTDDVTVYEDQRRLFAKINSGDIISIGRFYKQSSPGMLVGKLPFRLSELNNSEIVCDWYRYHGYNYVKIRGGKHNGEAFGARW